MSLLIPKNPPLRNRAYLDFLRSQPCIVTNLTETEPAHLRLNHMGGTSMKPHDWCALPLYWELHRQQNNTAEIKTWQRWAQDYPEFLARLLINEAKRRFQMWEAE